MPDNMPDGVSFYEAVLKQAVIRDYNRELASIPSEQELAKTLAYSPRHIARMNKLFATEERREFARRFFSTAKKAVTAAAVIVVILFGLLMLNPEVRAVVADTIVEWFETFTSFTSPHSETTDFNTGLRPSYVPEGFEEATVSESAEAEMVSVIYRSQTERIGLIYCPLDASTSVNNESVVYQEKTIGGTHFYVFESETNDADNILIWEDKGIRFSLTSTLSVDELLRMAQSFAAQ